MHSAPNKHLSRPVRLAADLVGGDERELEECFFRSRVIIGLEPELEPLPNSRLTVLTLCNQILRYCPNVLIATRSADLLAECVALAKSIYGPAHHLRALGDAETAEVTVMVGTMAVSNHTGITVNSSGWVARMLSGDVFAETQLESAGFNPISAVGAACLGAGDVFLRLIGFEVSQRQVELCMRTGRSGMLGSFEPGPIIATQRMDLDALLTGCGGVANGWAATLRHLQLRGQVAAVDRQVIGIENLGPYALAMMSDLGRWKSDVVQQALRPGIIVRPYNEEIDLFVPRVTEWGVPLPPLVITALDEAQARQTVQRLWPATLIDMAAGGTTAQAHVHRAGKGGQCLLGAHTVPPGTLSYAERVSALTGLRPERIIRAYNQPINEADVAAAPVSHEAILEAARKSGQLICGRITRANLDNHGGGGDDDDFAPAAPFVSGLSGAMGASLTLQDQLGLELESGLHWQYSFLSGRSLRLRMSCSPLCDCNSAVVPQEF